VRLKPGDRVKEIVSGEYRTVAYLYPQDRIPGGLVLDKPIDGLRSWNEDALELVLEVAE
jgi:hypothetical protein